MANIFNILKGMVIGAANVIKMQARASSLNPNQTATGTTTSGIITSLARTTEIISFKEPFIFENSKLAPKTIIESGVATEETSSTDFSISFVSLMLKAKNIIPIIQH